MNIAVLVYAQPRFINLSYKRLKEEYDIPGANVDFFIHFWEDVGFSPACDKTANYITYNNLQEYIEYINPKKYKIEDYKELDELVFLLKNTKSYILNDKVKSKNVRLKDRYEYGQWFSHKKAYLLMEEYEKENNMQYDLVIKTKTDYIYKRTDKEKQYIIPKKYLKEKVSLVSNIQTRYFFAEQTHHDETISKRLQEFIPNKTIETRLINCNFYRLKVDDINMVATRSAAYNLYNNWVETYLQCLTWEKNNKIKEHQQIYFRQDILFGYTAILNNITLLKKPRNYIRLYTKNSCKKSWVTNRADISIDVSDFKDYNDLDKSLTAVLV
tara:strand:- start:1973 stop:2953 length:981 start_codon:yes stop_codon:yes gene_type:complete